MLHFLLWVPSPRHRPFGIRDSSGASASSSPLCRCKQPAMNMPVTQATLKSEAPSFDRNGEAS